MIDYHSCGEDLPSSANILSPTVSQSALIVGAAELIVVTGLAMRLTNEESAKTHSIFLFIKFEKSEISRKFSEPLPTRGRRKCNTYRKGAI